MGLCGSKKEPSGADMISSGRSSGSPESMRRMSYSANDTGKDAVKLPFPSGKIGLHSNHGVKPSGSFGGTTNKINQDRGLISYPLCNNAHQMLLAVYDGHGLHVPDGQSDRLGGAISGHHGLLKVHLRAWGCSKHSGGEAERLRSH